MIDYMNEIFTAVASELREEHNGVKVIGEYTRSPSEFPCVTLDEIENVTVRELVDSSMTEKHAGVQYRLQVFSNKTSGKKAQARAIFATADNMLRGMGFHRVTYSTTPEIYNSTIYSITATYEGIISSQGFMYRR